jgi:hypothetical protein
MKSILRFMYLCADGVVESHISSALRTVMHFLFTVFNLKTYFLSPQDIGKDLNAPRICLE